MTNLATSISVKLQLLNDRIFPKKTSCVFTKVTKISRKKV